MRIRLSTTIGTVACAILVGWIARPAIADSPEKNAASAAKDARLGKPRHLRDAYHPWVAPVSKGEWQKESQAIRHRILVSNGLWPMPPKEALKPVIHGKIDRGGYTIEKVFFASYPGHYVTGNLYRPKNVEGKVPGVLSPHGHWQNGRFYDAGQDKAKKQVAKGAEKFLSGARYPLQARMVQLARMGCVVFHYDMVGYADSKQIGHRVGFTDAEAGLRMQNFMGLQTFNSIRALDFITSLSDVDPKRIGVTGASGGGTQTFMLCAIDPRPAVAFPAVMVSTGMQGGCICENCSYLRIGNNNIALAALFAPKPMKLSGADDWTVEIETKGLPELKHIYSLYGRSSLVDAKAYPEFKHNYNHVSRKMMLDWFKKHLKLPAETSTDETDFEPLSISEMSVFDDEHPLPKDAKSADELRQYMTEVSNRQYAALIPATGKRINEYRRIVGTAARVLLDEGVPAAAQLEIKETGAEGASSEDGKTFSVTTQLIVGRKGTGERIPVVMSRSDKWDGRAVLWIDGEGKSKQPSSAASIQLLEKGFMVVSADVYLTGEFVDGKKPPESVSVEKGYHGYTFGYNRPVLSNRVRDILTVIGALKSREGVKQIRLTGTGGAGVWVLLASALAGDAVDRTVVDLGGFGFGKIDETSDPNFLPGALKYGGVGGLAALAAPRRLTVAGTSGSPVGELKPLTRIYSAVGGDLTLTEKSLTPEEVVKRISR